MSLDDSLADVIHKVKQGEIAAVQVIWDRYFPQVVRLAGSRLNGRRTAVADEEDVAISVMESFFRAAAAGRFADLRDKDGIWRLLSTMTCRKAIDLIRKVTAKPTVDLDILSQRQFAPQLTTDPTPLIDLMFAEELERLFKLLDPKYHEVARLKLECLTVPEIAARCQVHVSTIERRLRIIREIWSQSTDLWDS